MRWALLGAFVSLPGCWGSPVSQTAECEAYVACIRGLDADAGLTTNVDRFVEGGVCWNNPLLAEGCTTACRRAVARLREREGRCLP